MYQSDTGKPLPQPKSAEDEIPLTTASEVRYTIRQLKENKAPGPNNITNDLLKNTGEVLQTKLAELFDECLHQFKIPKDWQTVALILLCRTRDKTDLKKLQPISLLNNLYKLFTKIITYRLTEQLDMSQTREQADFRRGYSTIDHLQSVNQIIEKSNKYKMPLCHAFIVNTKAFNSLELPAVIEALEVGTSSNLPYLVHTSSFSSTFTAIIFHLFDNIKIPRYSYYTKE